MQNMQYAELLNMHSRFVNLLKIELDNLSSTKNKQPKKQAYEAVWGERNSLFSAYHRLSLLSLKLMQHHQKLKDSEDASAGVEGEMSSQDMELIKDFLARHETFIQNIESRGCNDNKP